MVDLYNSSITVEIDLKRFKTPSNTFPALPYTAASGSTIGFKEPGVWVGFKDAMDIVGQYQLVASGQAFYTQSFAIEQSYITSLATTEQVKQVDPYSNSTIAGSLILLKILNTLLTNSIERFLRLIQQHI